MKTKTSRLMVTGVLLLAMVTSSMAISLICYKRQGMKGEFCFVYKGDVDCEVLRKDAKRNGVDITYCDANVQPQSCYEPEVEFPWYGDGESGNVGPQ